MSRKPQESPKSKVGPDGEPWARKTGTLTVSCYETDLELIDWLQEKLGCGRSEAVRTAVRAFAAQLSGIPTTGAS